MQRKLPRALSLATSNSMQLLDDDPFHWDTIRKRLNVSEGNSVQTTAASRNATPTFSNLVAPNEFPEVDAKELRDILRTFEESLTRNPEPSAVDCLVYVALLSRKYCVKRWELWATKGISNFIHDFPLLDISPSKTFVRVFRFATLCHDTQLRRTIEDKWITRLKSDDLSPIPAILVANELNSRELLGRALYAYVTIVEPQISNSQCIDFDSPLGRQLNLHVFSGYFALQAYWKHLCDIPLEFKQAEGCTAHTDCLNTWKPRWSIAISRQQRRVSRIDILSRLRFAEKLLRADSVCATYMAEKCRESALQAVSQKRVSLALNMHHIFDL